MPVYLTRRAVFSASHRLHSSELSDSENAKLFGKCNSANGHGHNYAVEITLKGEIDKKSGLLYNLSDLKRAIDSEILARVDHKHLNLDVLEFKSLNPTAENIAIVIWGWLEKALPKGLLYEVRLQETENNVAIYRGSQNP